MQSQKKFAKTGNYRRTHFGVQHLMKKLFPFIFLIFYFQETKIWKEKGDHLKITNFWTTSLISLKSIFSQKWQKWVKWLKNAVIMKKSGDKRVLVEMIKHQGIHSFMPIGHCDIVHFKNKKIISQKRIFHGVKCVRR